MKKQTLSFLGVATGILLVIEMAIHIIYGYYASGNVIILLTMGVLAIARYTIILICLSLTVWLISKKQFNKLVSFSLILLIVFSFIPKVHFETIGALLSLSSANSQQVLDDARLLAEEYPAMTCIGYPYQRFPCDSPVSHDKLPSSIRNAHVGNVLIMEKYVLLEKFGLQGAFRGFIVFRDGFDIWKNEKSISLQSGCNTCWKIRIIDGLYWYQANPTLQPIFVSPLK